MRTDPQAEQLNQAIESANPSVMRLLSRRGRAIFFPSKGIIQQSADAKNASINATIGTALDDKGGPMSLSSLEDRVKLPPAEAFLYAPPYGRPELRDLWERDMRRKNPGLGAAKTSKPVVTAALTHGLSMMGYLFVDEGDEIILPDLYWENYELIFEHAYGARFRTYPAFAKGGYNTEGLRDALRSGAPGRRIVLLNFPNNPTGYTVTFEEAGELREALVEAAEAGNDVLVLIDDAYFGLVFEKGVYGESMFAQLAAAHERLLAVKLDGATKEDYVWGFRVGFATFASACSTAEMYAALEKKLAGAIRGTISNVPNISQSLLVQAYSDSSYAGQKRERFEALKARCLKVRSEIEAHPEYAEVFTPLPYNSGYFMCVRMAGGLDAEAVRQQLIATHKVGVVALGNLLRLAFSSTPLESVPRLLQSIYLAGREVGARA